MLRTHALLAVALVALLGCGDATEETASEQAAAESTQEAPTVLEHAVEMPDGSAVAGAPLATDATEASLDDVLSHPEDYDGQLVRLTVPIDQVCQSSGCWMIIGDEQTQSRVTFLDYGFFVPKDVAGRTAELDVRVERSTMSVEEARHYASETEGEDPEAITEPVETISIVATGVRILPADGTPPTP